jgi:uncharacterized membrane protein YhhN
MFTKVERVFTILFCVLLIAEIYTATNYESLHYLAKPALLISLLLFFSTQSGSIETKTRRLIKGALSFSLLGDISLMFVDKSPHFFTAGLVSFLLAHILYIFVFLKKKNNTKKPGLFSGILILYGVGLFYVLKDHLGAMLLPVLFYMIVILSMAISAYLRQGSVPKISFYFVLIGAVLFLISDSLLAVNKFYEPLPNSNISIMFTYAFAQLFIVFGLLKQR